MPNAARLSGVGTFSAFEFDDNTKTSFSVSAGSTSFSNEFDENTSTTISGTQKMSVTSGGNLIVLDSINEVDAFDDIPTSNLELHLDASSGFTTTTLPTSWQDLSGNNRHMRITGDTNVSLLLNGNDLTDSSTYANTLSNNGISVNTSIKKYGTGSLLFEGNGGSTGDYGTFSHDTSFDIGTGDFTIEAWVYPQNSGVRGIAHNHPSFLGGGFTFWIGSDTKLRIENFTSGSGSPANIVSTTTVPNGTWAHVAYSRSGGTGYLFVNGNLQGTHTNSTNLTNNSAFYIGAAEGTNYRGIGYIDDLRFTVGLGRYTSNFTPPGTELSVYWSPYTDSDNTSSTSDASPPGGIGNGSLFVPMLSGVQPGQSMKISGISNASSNVRYRLYNSTNFDASSSNLTSAGEVTSSATLVNGPLTDTEGSREYFIEGTTYSLIIPPQHTFYNAVSVTNNSIVIGTSMFFSGAQILNVPFESSDSRLAVCDGTGSASAYTGVTGTAARTVILGVKVPASPSTSYTIFSYGANSAGQRFNIRLQSTGVIQIAFGSSFANIPVSAIDDRNDFLVIAVTVPASGTVSDVRVWLNGNEVTSQLIVNNGSTSINTSSANNVTIGGGSHGTVEYLDDSVITKVMMYSSVLSDLEIKQIYQSIIPDIYPFVERAS